VLTFTVKYGTKIPLARRKQLLGQRTLDNLEKLFSDALATGVNDALRGDMYDHIDTGMAAASLVTILNKVNSRLAQRIYTQSLNDIEAKRKRPERRGIKDITGKVIDEEGMENMELGLMRSRGIFTSGSQFKAFFHINYAIQVYQWLRNENEHLNWKTLDTLETSFRQFILDHASEYIYNKRVRDTLIGNI
jgi:hypothetical protein